MGHQQQQQQLSWEQVRDRVDVAERHRGLRAAHESVEVGRETLETLQDQKGAIEQRGREHVKFLQRRAELIVRHEREGHWSTQYPI